MNKPVRIALITGANRGIGLEVCRQLADAGFLVFLTARVAAKAEAAARNLEKFGTVEPVALDVADAASIRKAAQVVGSRRDPIVDAPHLLQHRGRERLGIVAAGRLHGVGHPPADIGGSECDGRPLTTLGPRLPLPTPNSPLGARFETAEPSYADGARPADRRCSP